MRKATSSFDACTFFLEITMGKWLENLNTDQKIVEFFRYCIVGVAGVVIHYGLYLLLNQWIGINVAYTIGYVISVCCHLWLTFRFTFQEKITFKRVGGYLLCNGVNYLLHMLFLNTFLWLGTPEQWAPIPVFCLVVPINFIFVRTVLKKWN